MDQYYSNALLGFSHKVTHWFFLPEAQTIAATYAIFWHTAACSYNTLKHCTVKEHCDPLSKWWKMLYLDHILYIWNCKPHPHPVLAGLYLFTFLPEIAQTSSKDIIFNPFIPYMKLGLNFLKCPDSHCETLDKEMVRGFKTGIYYISREFLLRLCQLYLPCHGNL